MAKQAEQAHPQNQPWINAGASLVATREHILLAMIPSTSGLFWRRRSAGTLISQKAIAAVTQGSNPQYSASPPLYKFNN